MKAVILFIVLVFSASAAEKLIFEDNFDTLNMKNWEHELTLSGGGNWEFQWYVNNRSNSYVKNGVLYIKPTMTEDAIGTSALNTGNINIWGGSPTESCTNNAFYGCERNAAASGNIINPIRSARLRTYNSFNFKYGRVEVRAQLPKGDWLWPAIWMLPRYNSYGNWPVSGEIDIMESRGNDVSYPSGGHNSFGSTLHWGTNWDQNKYTLTHKDYKHTTSLGDDFHVYGLYWDQNGLYTYLDNESNKVLQVDFTKQSFWERGQFPSSFDNPWLGQPNAAPFNQEFYLVLNLAVGGTSGYFPDGQGPKPWSDKSGKSTNEFWNARGAWQQTWKGEGAALKIDSVKVWSLDGQTQQEKVIDDFMSMF
jgi:beta-glucanase (GH16 family)